jgi:predicted DsbA family dithiol-disulfide isomerase
MHDTLYENAQALDDAALSKYAANVGLDRAAFDACMESGRYRESIARGAAAIQALGITGTPTFVLGHAVDGKVKGPQILGAQPAAAFASRIDALLEQGG